MALRTTEPAPSPPMMKSNCLCVAVFDPVSNVTTPVSTSTAFTRQLNSRAIHSRYLPSRTAMRARRMSPRDPVHPGNVHSSVRPPGILNLLERDHAFIERPGRIDVPDRFESVTGDIDGVKRSGLNRGAFSGCGSRSNTEVRMPRRARARWPPRAPPARLRSTRSSPIGRNRRSGQSLGLGGSRDVNTAFRHGC